MFDGKAEEAITFYTSIVNNSEILELIHYGPDNPGKEHRIKLLKFRISSQEYIAVDADITNQFTFTPSMAVIIESDIADEIDHLYFHLAKDGQILMPMDNYGFSEKFTWFTDRYGVSWHLKLK